MKVLSVAAFVLAGCTAPSSHIPPPAQPSPQKVAPPAQPEVQEPQTAPAKTANPLRTFQLKDLKRSEVQVKDRKIAVWIMDTDAKRSEGMMWLSDEDVKAEEGMLFVFRDAEPKSFWMGNTYIPLDIAYIAPDGKVLNVVRGKPLDETPLPSKGAAKYVLELKAGQAEKLGVKAGAMLQIPTSIKAVE